MEEPIYTESILKQADKIINGSRRTSYGDANESFSNIAKAWSIILKIEVTKEQVDLCMIMLKVVRESNKHKQDNLTDICGYAQLLDNMYRSEQDVFEENEKAVKEQIKLDDEYQGCVVYNNTSFLRYDRGEWECAKCSKLMTYEVIKAHSCQT